MQLVIIRECSLKKLLYYYTYRKCLEQLSRLQMFCCERNEPNERLSQLTETKETSQQVAIEANNRVKM